jgi:hypothetical protein
LDTSLNQPIVESWKKKGKEIPTWLVSSDDTILSRSIAPNSEKATKGKGMLYQFRQRQLTKSTFSSNFSTYPKNPHNRSKSSGADPKNKRQPTPQDTQQIKPKARNNKLNVIQSTNHVLSHQF